MDIFFKDYLSSSFSSYLSLYYVVDVSAGLEISLNVCQPADLSLAIGVPTLGVGLMCIEGLFSRGRFFWIS